MTEELATPLRRWLLSSRTRRQVAKALGGGDHPNDVYLRMATSVCQFLWSDAVNQPHTDPTWAGRSSDPEPAPRWPTEPALESPFSCDAAFEQMGACDLPIDHNGPHASRPMIVCLDGDMFSTVEEMRDHIELIHVGIDVPDLTGHDESHQDCDAYECRCPEGPRESATDVERCGRCGGDLTARRAAPPCGYGEGWPLIKPCALPRGHRGRHEWTAARPGRPGDPTEEG